MNSNCTSAISANELPTLSQLLQNSLQHAIYLFILCLKLFFCDVQLNVQFIIIVELAEDVGIIGLALADGRV